MLICSRAQSVRVVGLFLAAVALAAGLPPAASAGDVEVTVQPWPDPVVETYDPADGKPAGVGADEDAAAIPKVEVDGKLDVQNTADGVKVTGVRDLTVTGTSRIILPKDADADLKAHEQAHDTLNEEEYANAERKTKAAFAGFVGKVFVGAGATPTERQDDAFRQAEEDFNARLARAADGTSAQQNVINEKFDKLTAHGTGVGDGTKADETLNTDAGLKEARAEKAKAPDAGKQSFIPNRKTSPFVLASSATLALDIDANLIALTTPATIDGGAAAGDTLAGAQIDIGNLPFIGLLPNGAALLADTTIRLVDPVTGVVLLDGFLFELAFMPAGVDGFQSVLQGYLDVPPVFAGGVAPAGSALLQDLVAAADDPLRLSMFTLLFDGPIPVDAFGNLNVSTLTGTILIGTTSIPLPASLPLLVVAVATLAAGRARRCSAND